MLALILPVMLMLLVVHWQQGSAAVVVYLKLSSAA
jgi:hypothetical protein